MIGRIPVLLVIFILLLSRISHAYVMEKRLTYQCLYTDDQNRLWIGTQNGLYLWRNQKSDQKKLPKDLHITAIAGNNQQLLLGTKGGELYRYNIQSGQLDSLGDTDAEIASMISHQTYWIISTLGEGIVIVGNRGIQKITTQQGLLDNYIYQVVPGDENSCWASGDRGICEIQLPGKVINPVWNKNLPDRLITCLDYREGYLYTGSQGGFFCRIQVRNGKIENLKLQLDSQQAEINAIKILDNHIALCTSLGGFLYTKRNQQIKPIYTREPLKSMTMDCEGNLWAINAQTLIYSLGEQVTMVSTSTNQPLRNVHTLLAGEADHVYLSADKGLMKINLDGFILNEASLPSQNENTDITSLYLDENGKLWVGTSGQGLFQTDTGTLQSQPILINHSPGTNTILSISGNSEWIWVATLDGVWIARTKTMPLQFVSLENLLHTNKYYVYQLKLGKDNQFWMATDGKGLIQGREFQLQQHPSMQSLHQKVIYGLSIDSTQNCWFTVYNEGVYALQGKDLLHFTRANGLQSNDIQSICNQTGRSIVLASSEGIDLIQPSDHAVIQIPHETLPQGWMPELNASIALSNNEVWLGGNTGIMAVYNPSYRKQWIPSSRIEEISVFGQIILNKHLFDASENYFRFKIGATANRPQTIYYRYRLRGLSDNWMNTNDQEIVFPRLMPGEYTFELQSANNREFREASLQTYQFEINRPFYLQLWFITLCLLATILLAILLIRFRDKRVNRLQQLEKEKVVAEFETLKNQVNPHFLFNSFNTLIQVIDEDPEKAIEYTQMLSDYYRSLLSYRNIDLVLLSEEIILLEKYIYLQKMRFGDALVFKNNIQPEIINLSYIPPLTLQILAENALKHNIVSQANPLFITLHNDTLDLIIENNIQPKQSKEAGEQIGLQNIRLRFRLINKRAIEIHTSDDLFIIRLPIIR